MLQQVRYHSHERIDVLELWRGTSQHLSRRQRPTLRHRDLILSSPHANISPIHFPHRAVHLSFPLSVLLLRKRGEFRREILSQALNGSYELDRRYQRESRRYRSLRFSRSSFQPNVRVAPGAEGPAPRTTRWNAERVEGKLRRTERARCGVSITISTKT
jgi:hypothetical protein